MADDKKKDKSGTKSNDKDKKEYTTQDIVGILQSLMQAAASGDLSGTVVGEPMDASQYDAVAANSHAMMQAYLSKYSSQMLLQHRLTRTGAVSAAMGLGQGGVDFINMISKVNPTIGNNLIGLPGFDQARNIALQGANGMAMAMGRPTGSVTDPAQMATNIRWAATQGAMALGNAFDKDGSVNARFTHGLSLPQSAVLNNAILSDSSHYEEWSKKETARTRDWMASHEGATERDRLNAGILTENQISGFKNGTGLTGAAVKSFNDHIKGFQEEINAFVASVSKMTGSFDSAIDFMQDMTNGKMFSAGNDAKAARDKAAGMAANLRIMAADANMDPRELYSMMNNPYSGFGAVYNAARGADPAARYVGDRSTTANIAALSAGAMAQWRKSHPGASSAEQEKAFASIHQRVQNFAKGDADEQNVLLAEMVRRGGISADEAKKLAASGEQEAVYQKLKSYYGNNVDSLLKNKVQIERLSKKNSPMVNELNTLSINEGFTSEDVYYNQRNAMRDGKMMLSSRLGAVFGKNVTRDVDRLHKEALLDENVLREAGLDDEKIKEIQQKGKKWSASTIHRHLVSKMGANELALNKNVSKTLGSKLEEKFGDNEQAKEAINQFKEDMAETMPELTEDDVRTYAVRGDAAKVSKRLATLRNKYMGAMSKGDEAAMFSALDEMGEAVNASVSGKGDTFNRDAEFTKFMLEETMRGQTDDSDKADRLAATGKNVFMKSRDASLTYEQSMDVVRKNLGASADGKGISFDALSDPKKRQEMMRKYRMRSAAQALGKRIVGAADLSEEDAELVNSRFLEDFRKLGEKDFKKYASEEGAKNLKGAELDSYIARRAAVDILTKDADSDKNEILKKAGLSTDAIRNMGNKEEAMNIVNAAFFRSYDSVGADIGVLKKSVDPSKVTKEERDKLALRKAAGNVDNLAFSSQLANVSSESMDSAASELSADRKDTVQALDVEQAKGVTRPLGKIGEIDREMLKSKLGIDKQKGAIKDILEGKDSIASKTGVKNQVIAKQLQKFLNEHEGESDEALRNALKEDKGLGRLRTAAFEAFNNAYEVGEGGKKGDKISTRKAMEAYIHAANVNSGDLDKDVENGLMTSSIRHKEKGTQGVNDEAMQLLRNIEAALVAISGRQQAQNH